MDFSICRFLYNLRKKAWKKNWVEAFIYEAYIAEEIAMFCSHYFEPGLPLRTTKPIKNDNGVEPYLSTISIFNHQGRPFGRCKSRFLGMKT